MESVLFSFVFLFWLVIAVLLSYMAFRSLLIWTGEWNSLLEAKCQWLYVFLDTRGGGGTVAAMWLSCVLCLVVANDHQLSPSVLHWPPKIPHCPHWLLVHIHTDFLPRPQPDAHWQQPAVRGGTWAADLHFEEAEQRSPAGGHGQHRHCGTQVIILHIPSQRCYIPTKRDTKARRRDNTTQDHVWLHSFWTK